LDSTLGQNKAKVLASRIKDINTETKVHVVDEFILPARVWELLDEYKPDYVMDCIDSVTPKIEWITACKMKNIKIITHLGAGGKIDPSKVQVAKLPDSYNCKLGQHIKRRLKAKKITYDKIKCVFSAEMQDKDSLKLTDGSNFKKSFYGTISYIPALFGLLGASEVIRYLTLEERRANNQ
jgi:tRNA A37 threonylcarbamoyladenosine dehydratase